MEGTNQPLIEYLQEKREFVVPVYQRNYDWKPANCRRLFDDIIETVRSGESSHFFGSIVVARPSETTIRHDLIIDGQQRITYTDRNFPLHCSIDPAVRGAVFAERAPADIVNEVSRLYPRD